MSITAHFPLDTKSFNILRHKSHTTHEFSDVYYDNGDKSLVKRGCFLFKRYSNNNDMKEWILNDNGKITRSKGDITTQLGDSGWKKTYNNLLAIHNTRRYYLEDIQSCKIHIDEINFSLDDFYLVGTIISERQKLEDVLKCLEEYTECEVLHQKCRSSILEYLYSYKPKLYDYLKEKKMGVEDVKYCCSRRSNRPTLDVDGKSHKISFKEAQKLWHHLEDYLDNK